MSKIKMLQSIPGALNGGLDVKLFKQGLIYDTEDMEGLDKIFLQNNFAEVHNPLAEVIRHQRGMTGAPINKREALSENKLYTAEDLADLKAGDIRKLAEENGVDLHGARRNTSAETLASMYIERQDN
jgi:hypothetical protein